MSQYSDLVADLVSYTNRADLTSEMNVAIRRALRAAHLAGKWVFDQVTATVPVTQEQIQAIDLRDSPFERLRIVRTVKPTSLDFDYTILDNLDLFDADGIPRSDVAYVVGNTLHIRADYPVDSIDVTYVQLPEIPTNLDELDDWILETYPDAITLHAAATVLAMTGEQEIKTRIEGMLRDAWMELKQDALSGAPR